MKSVPWHALRGNQTKIIEDSRVRVLDGKFPGGGTGALPRAVGLCILAGTVSSGVGLALGYFGMPIGLVWVCVPAGMLPWWGDSESWKTLAFILLTDISLFLGLGALLWAWQGHDPPPILKLRHYRGGRGLGGSAGVCDTSVMPGNRCVFGRSSMRCKLLVLSILWLAAATLQAQSPRPAPRTLKIAMIAKSSANFVFLSAQRGAEDAARALSQKHGVAIEVMWLTPGREDAAVQAQRISQAVRDGAKAVLISCSDAALLTGPIDAAVDAGLVVMTFDSDAPASKRFAFYGADDADLGDKVMTDLAEQLGGQGQVAILVGSPNAPRRRRRAVSRTVRSRRRWTPRRA